MMTPAKRKRSTPAKGVDVLDTSNMSFSEMFQLLREHKNSAGIHSVEDQRRLPAVVTMSDDAFEKYLAIKNAEITEKLVEEKNKKMGLFNTSASEMRLAELQRREAVQRERIETREMRKYYKKNPFDEKSFKADVKRYDRLYVFCFGYAKLESPIYKDFMKSLTDDKDYQVYFGSNKALAYSVGFVKETEYKEGLKLGDTGYETKELEPGLRKIGRELDGDDVGVLLTNKGDDEVLSKFRQYEELDFLKPGQTPMKQLVFEKDAVLPLPPLSEAKKLCPKLKKLGMPVKLSGQDIKLTESFTVCEVGVRVTSEAAEILVHLGEKMFNYVLVPICCWSRSTKKTKYFRLELPRRG